MPLQLTTFPLVIPRGVRATFHDSFTANRHGLTHDAIDVAAPEGTTVVAATAGVVLHRWMSGHGLVTGAGYSQRGGYVVMMIDNDGFAHYYAHMLGMPGVQPGQLARAGEILGQVSNTGDVARGTPKHLHYQAWEIGPGRDQERTTAFFTSRFYQAVNPYTELVRLARGLGAQVQPNGFVVIDRGAAPSTPSRAQTLPARSGSTQSFSEGYLNNALRSENAGENNRRGVLERNVLDRGISNRGL